MTIHGWLFSFAAAALVSACSGGENCSSMDTLQDGAEVEAEFVDGLAELSDAYLDDGSPEPAADSIDISDLPENPDSEGEVCLAVDRAPAVSLCGPGFAECEIVEAIDLPYIRGSVRVRASVGCAAEPGLSLSIRLGNEGKTCTGFDTCDLEVASLPSHTVNALVEAEAKWPNGFQASWSRVLPVYDCVIPVDRTFCLKFDDWYEQTLPDTLDAVVTKFDAELTRGGGGIDLVAITVTWGADNVRTDRVVHKTWNGFAWGGAYFPDVVYAPFRGIDLVERPSGGSEALAQVFASYLPDLGVLDLGNPPDVTVVLPGERLSTCMQEATNLAFGWNARSGAEEPPTTVYGLVGSKRYAIVDGVKLGDQVLVTDEGGSWTCQPLGPMLAGIVPPVEGWPQSADKHWPGFSVPGAVSDADGTLSMAFEADAGVPVLASKSEGEPWRFMVLPNFGTTIPSPTEPLPAGSVQRIGTVYILRTGMEGEVVVFRYPTETLVPDSVAALSRYRIAGDTILANEDLSALRSFSCDAPLLPGSTALPPGPSTDCHLWAMDMAVDACGREHGVMASSGGSVENVGWQIWPGATFDNVSGEWQGTAVPEFGMFEGGVRLLITPDGAEHLFAQTSPMPPPGASIEEWSAGFRLRHWIRPCAVPFVE